MRNGRNALLNHRFLDPCWESTAFHLLGCHRWGDRQWVDSPDCQDFSAEGLFLSLHPHFYKSLSPEIFDKSRIPELQRFLETVRKAAEITRVPMPLVFHGGRAEWDPFFRPLDNALASSKAFFRWIDQTVVDNYGDIIPVCETQIPWSVSNEGMVRLGDTYKAALNWLTAQE